MLLYSNMRRLSDLTTEEMLPPEYEEFREAFIKWESAELRWKGVSPELAKMTAEQLFTDEENSETPFAKRNNAVKCNRTIPANEHHGPENLPEVLQSFGA
tara:strand:+ start:166 stop:465 length:300 start_codon:yes stop_codon:yes gene_type:complete